jgi:butyrate kinase
MMEKSADTSGQYGIFEKEKHIRSIQFEHSTEDAQAVNIVEDETSMREALVR